MTMGLAAQLPWFSLWVYHVITSVVRTIIGENEVALNINMRNVSII